MPDIKASPGNETFLALLGALRRGRQAITPEGEGLGAKAGRFVLDSVAPMGAFDEAENLAYGNMPMQVPPTSRIPQFKKGRADTIMDLQSVIPTSTVVNMAKALRNPVQRNIMAPIGSKVPNNPVGEGRKSVQDSYIQTALEMEKEGATPSDIHTKLGLSRILRTRPTSEFGGMWQRELPYNIQETKFLRSAVMGPEQKERFFKSLHPEWYADPQKYEKELNLINKSAVPRPGIYELKDLMNTKALADRYPGLERSAINVMNEPHADFLGSFDPYTKMIDLNIGRTGWEPYKRGSPYAVVGHELGHKIQDEAGLPGGSNIEMFKRDRSLTDDLEGVLTRMDSLNLPEQQRKQIAQLRDYMPRTDDMRYWETTGEQAARLPETRAYWSPETRALMDPTIKSGLESELFQAVVPNSPFVTRNWHSLPEQTKQTVILNQLLRYNESLK